MGCGHLHRHRSQVEDIEETQYDLNSAGLTPFPAAIYQKEAPYEPTWSFLEHVHAMTHNGLFRGSLPEQPKGTRSIPIL